MFQSLMREVVVPETRDSCVALCTSLPLLLQCCQRCTAMVCRLLKTMLLLEAGTAAAAMQPLAAAAACPVPATPQATCTTNGTWTINGSCTRERCFGLSKGLHVKYVCYMIQRLVHNVGMTCTCATKQYKLKLMSAHTLLATDQAIMQCIGLPPAQGHAAASGWNSSCNNATAGSTCSLTCAADSTGDGYQASCTASGNWSVNGTCECGHLLWVLRHACAVCL
jgi:hypothetical protein